METKTASSLSGINTPLSPGEALARLSPLRACGAAPLRSSKQRHASARWRRGNGSWWVGNGKATAVTRSVSASAVPLTSTHQKGFQAEYLTRDRVTGWRPTVRRQEPVGYKCPSYTADQIAGFQLYEMKSRRLSSLEYGNNVQSIIPEATDLELGYESPPQETSPSRIVELEAETPTISPVADFPDPFQPRPPLPAMSSPLKHSPLQFPSQTPPASITRKPVGSGRGINVPKSVRSKSDPLLIWPLEISKSPGNPRSQFPQKTKCEFEPSSSIDSDATFSPWDTYTSPPSPSLFARSMERRPRPNSKRPQSPAHFQSDLCPKLVMQKMDQNKTERRYNDHRSLHYDHRDIRYVAISFHNSSKPT
jgi:hypothetical protein